MGRMTGRRRLTCHHEAGHALARWWLGFYTDRAVVLSVEEVLARTPIVNRRGVGSLCEGMIDGHDIHFPFARESLDGMGKDRDRYEAQAGRRVEMALVELYAGAYAEARHRKWSSLACFLAGGAGDLDSARRISDEWFVSEADKTAANRRAERYAAALVRSPKGAAAIRAMADALHEHGEIDGDAIEAHCRAAYGAEPQHDAWADHWPPTLEQIRHGFIPPPRRRAAA